MRRLHGCIRATLHLISTLNLESSVNWPLMMMRCFKTATYTIFCSFCFNPLDESAYAFDCTFFRLICLTAKALGKMTMRAFLVGATEPKKRTLKRVQLRVLG